MATLIKDFLADYYTDPLANYGTDDNAPLRRYNYEANGLFAPINEALRAAEKLSQGWKWFNGLCRLACGASALDTRVNLHPHRVQEVCDDLGITTYEELTDWVATNNKVNAASLLAKVQQAAPDLGYLKPAHVYDFWPAIKTKIRCMEGLYIDNLEDYDYRAPTREQVQWLVAKAPFMGFVWLAEKNDCDDASRIWRGWLSANGLGNLTVFVANINIFNDAGVVVGKHSLLICYFADGTVSYLEPQNGNFVDDGYTLGIPGATYCELCWIDC